MNHSDVSDYYRNERCLWQFYHEPFFCFRIVSICIAGLSTHLKLFGFAAVRSIYLLFCQRLVCCGQSLHLFSLYLFDHFFKYDPIYVDKTLFIKEIIEKLPSFMSIVRPRRFGKSSNVSMLKQFLAGSSEEYFKTCELYKQYPEFVAQHFGQYVVRHVDFVKISTLCWPGLLKSVKYIILGVFDKFFPTPFSLENLPSSVRDMYEQLVSGETSEVILCKSLRLLIEILSLVQQKPVVVLID